MPAYDVFISHAREDKQDVVIPLIEALKRVNLKVWFDADELQPGNSLRSKIDEGLAHSHYGVVILSTAFFRKQWTQMELDALFARAEHDPDILIPVWHHMDHAAVAQHSPLLAGRLALNTAVGIPQLAEGIAERLKRPRPTLQSPGKSLHLTVQCTLDGAQLTRTYWYQHGRITEHRSPWQWTVALDTGAALFQTLFGSPEQGEKVLQVLFGTEPARPILHPVHVRIHTNTPQLANLPWATTTWEGNALRDSGWTFSLLAGSPGHVAPNAPDVLLKAPCPVFMLAPGTAPDVEVHHRALEERLLQAWPSYHEKPMWIRDWEGFVQAWPRRRPPVIYYYGPVENDGHTLRLLFDGADGQQDWRSVAALQQVWQTQPPQIVFCNGVGQSVLLGTAMASLALPLVITQSSAEPHQAQRAALAWLHELLQGGEDTDPVWALQQHGLASAVAWSAYGTWRTRTAPELDKEKLVSLLLDRKSQRALGQSAVSELVHDVNRRLHCVLAYGAAGNLVERFAAQLAEHLRRTAKEIAQVHRIPMRLPTATLFDVTKLAFEVRRHWGLGERESFGVALHKRKPQGPGRAHPVLLLDWGVRGTSDSNRLSLEALEAWLDFCCLHLAAQCPRDIRLISLLALEIAPENHHLLEQRVRTLRAAARFRDRAFRIELLPRLDTIEVSDLADFLDTAGNSTCPDDLIDRMPEFIVAKTGGSFAETVALLEEAERTGWYTLFDTLNTELGQPAPGTPPQETLL